MLTKQNYTTPKRKRVPKKDLQKVSPKPSSDSSLMKKNATNNFVKRLSPFLITVILLPFIAVYAVMENVHFFEHMWLQLIVFGFIEFNLLLLDYALWNYFNGKKVAGIWVIELMFESLLFYCIL